MDTDWEAGSLNQPVRAQVRDQAILRSLVGGAGLQVSIAVATLVSLPFVTRELDTAEFGVFATLTGFAALFALADFGIGGALTTRLAEARGADDAESALRAVSTAVVAALVAGILVAVLLGLSLLVVPWQSLLGTHVVSSSAIDAAILATAAAVGLSVPAAIGQRILYGLDRGGVANLWLLAGSICAALVLVAGTRADWPLFMFVLVALGVPALAGIGSGISAVIWLAPRLRPRFSMASADEWQVLRRTSGWYFVVAVATAASFQLDALIVASVLGAADAGEFALTVRVFGLISASLTPALLQLWPAFGDAFARGDMSWIKSRLIWSTVAGVAASAVAGLVVVMVGPGVIGTLFTSALSPDRALLVALAGSTAFGFLTAPSYVLLNATGYVRVHALVALAAAAVNFPVSLALSHRIGIAGPAWGTLIAGALCTVVPGVLAVRAVLVDRRSGTGPINTLPATL